MNQLLLFSIIGFASGIIVFPIGLWIYIKIRDTIERRKIKRDLKKGKFLVTIDPKDYDVKAWQNQVYGNIDVNETKKDLEKLNERIFNKPKEPVDKAFLEESREFYFNAKENGYTDDEIIAEFRKQGYTEELIREVFNNE